MPWIDDTYNNMLSGSRILQRTTLGVGIVDRQTHVGPTGRSNDMARLYAWHDMGTRRTPKRETLNPAVRQYPLLRNTRHLVEAMARGNTVGGLNYLGNDLKDAVKHKIHILRSPRLRPATISARRRRGNSSTNPLVDSGQLSGAINYRLT